VPNTRCRYTPWRVPTKCINVKNMENKQIRLKNWDYSSSGVYYITICCADKQPFFGKIKDGSVQFSEIGEVAKNFWVEIPNHFKHVELDAFIIMPDHLHGILILMNTIENRDRPFQKNEFSKPVKNSLSVIINQYKSSVKRWCNKNGHLRFEWQSRFYDHIIRDDQSFDEIRHYILTNPSKIK
jgi:putative transposase